MNVVRGTFRVYDNSDVNAVVKMLKEIGVNIKKINGQNIRASYVPGKLSSELPIYSLCANGLLKLKIKGEEDHRIEIKDGEAIVGYWSYKGETAHALFDYYNYNDKIASDTLTRNDGFGLDDFQFNI